MRNYRRKNYFIKKRFQIKYTLSIVLTLLVVMLASGVGVYVGMWASVIENFSKFKVSENLENVRRIAGYEEVRFKKGDYRIERIFREAELLSAKDRDVLETALVSVNRSLIPKVALLSIFIFIGGIFLSHKIAGPIYRIERSAEAIRDGDLRANFKIRRGDEVIEAASVLEEMVESLHRDIERLKMLILSLKGNIEALSECAAKERVEGLKNVVKEIESLLSKYKT